MILIHGRLEPYGTDYDCSVTEFNLPLGIIDKVDS